WPTPHPILSSSASPIQSAIERPMRISSVGEALATDIWDPLRDGQTLLRDMRHHTMHMSNRVRRIPFIEALEEEAIIVREHFPVMSAGLLSGSGHRLTRYAIMDAKALQHLTQRSGGVPLLNSQHLAGEPPLSRAILAADQLSSGIDHQNVEHTATK